MGRFDALTQLEKKPITPTPFAEKITAPDQFTSKPANQQGSLPTNVQTSKPPRKQTSLPANQQTSKLLKKFGSYLTEESIRGLKRIAFETDCKDYEVLQEAVDQYLASKK